MASKGKDFTVSMIFGAQERLMSYCCSQRVYKRAQENLTLGTDPHFGNQPGIVEDDDERDFDVSICGKSAQHVGVKCLLRIR